FVLNSLKKVHGILIGIALNVYIALGNIDIFFTILILPIHEHGIFFHLFVSFLNFFQKCSIVLEGYRSFTSLVRFIPRYLMLLGAIVNGIDSLISLSSVSLLVYRNATDFWALILYPATLKNRIAV
uniref:Uncharacterized protein n=1 Tax=Canis lupus familiaris TaxID=9615 RepID=A0A8I3PTM8_CANLF